VTNLNADRLDGLDSTSFVSTTSFRRVGPVVTASTRNVPLATIGHFSFTGDCNLGNGPQDTVELLIQTSVADSAFGSVTQAAAGGQFGDADMLQGANETIAKVSASPGSPDFNPVSGSAVEPNGHQVTFDLYQGMNARHQSGLCILGGTFAVK
jgi:hypothetical protein